MKRFRTLLFLLSLFAFAGFLFAHDEQEHGNFSGGDFENGYMRGYQHGSEDLRVGMNFDFRQDNEYQNSGSEHRNYDTNGTCDARVGYLEGYVDGYYRHGARFGGNISSGYGSNSRYENNSGHGTYPGAYTGSNVSVVAFTNSGYSGHSQQFNVGQYPHLDDPLNDSIDSMTVRGNVRVILFDNSNFRGQRVVLDHDFSDLGDFRSKAASMIVESINR